jgi:hypothetical protein
MRSKCQDLISKARPVPWLGATVPLKDRPCVLHFTAEADGEVKKFGSACHSVYSVHYHFFGKDTYPSSQSRSFRRELEERTAYPTSHLRISRYITVPIPTEASTCGRPK